MANINGVNPPAINDVEYVDKITNSFNAIDEHDHTTGKGAPIGTTALADGSVTVAKLADNSVSTNKIQGAAVTSDKIANGAVGALAILDGAITNIKIDAAAAIAYSKLNLAAAVKLVSDVTGILPVANGGTGSATQNFVDLTTGQTIAGNKKFSNVVSGTQVDVGTVGVVATLSLPTTMIVTLSQASELQQIAAGASGQVLILTNINSSDLVIKDEYAATTAKIFTGNQEDLLVKPNGSVFLYYNNEATIEAWCVIGGAGGSSVSNNTYTGLTITATADASQKWRYNGPPGVAVVTSIDFSAMPDGGRLIVTGYSDTNISTLPVGLTGVQQNGERVLTQYSTIEYIKDDTQLIEVSRNGI
jgi:hypothetical protein